LDAGALEGGALKPISSIARVTGSFAMNHRQTFPESRFSALSKVMP
jgi:hypothetical protein